MAIEGNPCNDATVILNEELRRAGLEPLSAELSARFEAYLSLILRWSERLNLTAVRSYNVLIINHLIESIAVAHALPPDVRTLLDFGSGAGLPGIPIALCRSEISITLAESQGKKAAFLQEAVRTLGIQAKVHADRAENLRIQFDCVTLRAVDKMQTAVAAAARLVGIGGWLAPMTTLSDAAAIREAAGEGFLWNEPVPLPISEQRVLLLGKRVSSSA